MLQKPRWGPQKSRVSISELLCVKHVCAQHVNNVIRKHYGYFHVHHIMSISFTLHVQCGRHYVIIFIQFVLFILYGKQLVNITFLS